MASKYSTNAMLKIRTYKTKGTSKTKYSDQNLLNTDIGGLKYKSSHIIKVVGDQHENIE